MARYNPSIVYPVGSLGIRRTPGTGPKGTWDVLSHRADPKTKELPAGVLVLATLATGKLARTQAEEFVKEPSKLEDRVMALESLAEETAAAEDVEELQPEEV
jgi:hypothetical protein